MEQARDLQTQVETWRGAGASINLLTVAPSPDQDRTILMIHENRGLVPYMVAVAEDLARAGYRVVAPDLLSRIGGTAAFAHDPSSVTTRQVESATHQADLSAVFDTITAEEGQAPAVVGFCFGAEMGWSLITERTPRGAVLYYGIGPDPRNVARIACPVYAVYAEDDPRVNDTFEPLGRALAAATVPIVAESYPGTKHAFHDRTRPDRFHAAAAGAVWARTLHFLAELFDTD